MGLGFESDEVLVVDEGVEVGESVGVALLEQELQARPLRFEVLVGTL
jgi:hypothetical protein